VHPTELWARFTRDPPSGKYEARLGFRLGQVEHKQASSPRGIPVTDIQWRALGRTWLGESNRELSLDNTQLRQRLQATDIYLALGLSRGYQDEYWLLVVGVHAVPDYTIEIDYNNL
jgi:hypothetical protein